MEGLAASQHRRHRGGRAQELGLRHDHDAERDDDQDSEPEDLGAEVALLRDGHDQPYGVGKLTPHAERAERAVDTDHDPDWVVRVHVCRVQPPLLPVVQLDGRDCRAVRARALGLTLVERQALCHLATRPEPMVHGRVGGVEEGGFRDVHVQPKEVEQRLAEALGQVGGAVGAEAQPQLGDEDEPIWPSLGVTAEWAPDRGHGGQVTWLGEEYDPQLVQLALGHGELVEVVLGIVAKAVDRQPEHASRALEDGEIAHELSQVRLEFFVPLGHCAKKLSRSRGRRQTTRPQPRQHLWSRVADKVLWHVVHERGGVDGDGREATEVEGGHARATTLSSTPISVELELACGGALRVEVHRPEREVWEEVVPAKAAHPAQLFTHRRVALREGDQVRHEHRLQLDIRIEPRALEQVGYEVLVGVVGQPTPQIRSIEVRVDGRAEVE